MSTKATARRLGRSQLWPECPWPARDHRELTPRVRVAPRRHLREQIKFFAIHEVAEQLGVSTRTVRRWIENMELVAHRFGRAVRIAERDLQAFVAMHRDS